MSIFEVNTATLHREEEVEIKPTFMSLCFVSDRNSLEANGVLNRNFSISLQLFVSWMHFLNLVGKRRTQCKRMPPFGDFSQIELLFFASNLCFASTKKLLDMDTA